MQYTKIGCYLWQVCSSITHWLAVTRVPNLQCVLSGLCRKMYHGCVSVPSDAYFPGTDRNYGIMFTCKVTMYFWVFYACWYLIFFLFDSPLPLLLLTSWAWGVHQLPAQVRPLLPHPIVCLWTFLLINHCQLLLSLQGKKITFLGRMLLLKGAMWDKNA